MKLLEFANKNPEPGRRPGMGYNRSARECAVDLRLADTCVPDPDAPVLISVVNGATTPGTYAVKPWTAEAVLHRSIMCAEDDDEKWLKAALDKANELIVGRALVIEATDNAETWIGATGAQSVSLAGSTVANKAAGVIAGRAQWFASVVDDRNDTPALHVPPAHVPDLMSGNIIAPVGSDIETVWGDPVVISEGYERATSNMFWSGDIDVYISEMDGLGPHIIHQQNDIQYTIAEVFAIDLNPCSIVRIGAYTA